MAPVILAVMWSLKCHLPLLFLSQKTVPSPWLVIKSVRTARLAEGNGKGNLAKFLLSIPNFRTWIEKRFRPTFPRSGIFPYLANQLNLLVHQGFIRKQLHGVLRKNFPSTLSDLKLWLDASDSSTVSHTSNAVTHWDDKSGNDYDVRRQTKHRPQEPADMNGKNVIILMETIRIKKFKSPANEPMMAVCMVVVDSDWIMLMIQFFRFTTEFWRVNFGKCTADEGAVMNSANSGNNMHAGWANNEFIS